MNLAEHNYILRFYRAEAENSLNKPGLYKGIYYIDINRLITVAVIPEFFPEQSKLARQEELDLDDVDTINDARTGSAFFPDYIITENNSKAGQEECVELSQMVKGLDEKYSPPFFYLNTRTFQRLSGELDHYASQTSGVHAYVEKSVIQSTFVGEMIGRMLKSPLFTEAHRRIIEAEKWGMK